MRLEGLLGLPDSIDQHITRLRKFYGYLVGWEPLVMAQVGPLQANLAERQKLLLLERDLNHFGMTSETLQSIPRCQLLPRLDDVPAALGSMYVLEGSTLGGQIISRRLEDKFGLRNGSGYSFFQGYGKDTAKMWQGFLSVLATHSPAEHHHITIRAARETFESLYQWFSVA
jgi:heme oxygenase